MLSTLQIESFRRDGYLAVRQVIDPQILAELREASDALLDESRRVRESNEVFDLESDHSAENPRLRRISHPVVMREVFHQTGTSDAVLDCVEALIGPDIKFHHSKLNWKTGGGGVEIGWHQDAAFFPHTNFDLVACGIALDDSTTENGCLLVLPGTHRLPVLNHRTEDREFVGMVTETDRIDPDTAVPVELKAGDMSIHHIGVVHGSHRNTSDRPRRLLIFQYAAADAMALDWRVPANELSNRVVRGKPATHARLDGAMRIPLRGDIGSTRSLFDRQQAARTK